MQHSILVRHGTTEAIEKRLMQGASDSPLSAKGSKRRAGLPDALSAIRFNAAFSSPMGRAWETAHIMPAAPRMEAITLDDLHEMDFGFYEKKPYFASPDEEPRGLRRLYLLIKVIFAQATGESLRSVSRKTQKDWAEISAQAPAGKLLIVSHGVLINYLLKHVLNEQEFRASKPPP